MQDKLRPLEVLLSCLAIASLGGFFSLLRSQQPLTARGLVAATLYSGLIGLVIGLLWFNYFAPANLFFLIGTSGLAGLGGVTLLDVVVNVIAKGGVNITIKPKSDGSEEDGS